MSDLLKLMALDEEDLTVLSAHLQDAVVRAADITYEPQNKLLTIPMNRFAWEAPAARRWFFKKFERRLAVLTLQTVEKVQRRGIRQDDDSQIVSLLALSFDQDDDYSSGTITLHCSDNVSIRVEVGAIEVRLTDLGGTWEASGKPHHPLRGAPSP